MGKEAHIVAISAKDSEDLGSLQNLPQQAKLVAVGTADEILGTDKEELKKVNVLLSTGFGIEAKASDEIDKVWSHLPNLNWVHATSAGITHILTDRLVKSDVVLTNAKGTFSSALAEYGLTACLYFAKQIQQLQASQKASKWEPLYIEELRGKQMGIIGYGDIGQATGRLAKAFGMKIAALRRRTELSKDEEASGLQVYRPNQLNELISSSDYIVNALPATPDTENLVSAEAISNFKENAVFINLGRGSTVNEAALTKALKEKKLRGAALDVFAQEPLPESSELWGLENVLISPHCADRTTTFLGESVEQFVENVKLYTEGKELQNICDKHAGY